MATLDLVICEFIVLAVVCFFLIRYFKDAGVTVDVSISVYLCWVLGFAGILLLPYDMSVAVIESEHIEMLGVVWKFIYWSTFLLAWVVLPIQMEYHSSGHFNFLDKFLDALKRNIMAGVIAATVGIIYVVFMVASHRGSFEEVVGFMMAMGNTYGVFIIIVLMGTGLVDLPRRLWQLADYDRELQRLYISAGSIEAAYQESRYELEDCEFDVSRAAELVERLSNEKEKAALTKHIQVLQDKVANFTFAARSHSRQYVRSSGAGAAADADATAAALTTKAGVVDLHSRLMRAQVRARASHRRWRMLLRQCTRVEKLVSVNTGTAEERNNWCQMRTAMSVGAAAAAEYAVTDSVAAPCCSCCCSTSVQDSLQAIWSKRLFKLLTRWLAIVCAVLSALILWSELVMSSSLHSPIGMMMGAYSSHPRDHTVLAQAVGFVALAYMSICTYWSLFRLNLGWAYAMHGPQQSSMSALVFNGEYLSRLQFPLGNNFVMILNAPRMSLTAFSELMQNIQLVPVFGTSFQVYIPLLMILVALMTLFELVSRILGLIGIEFEDSVESFRLFANCCSRSAKAGPDSLAALSQEDREKYDEGKKLVSSELRQMALTQQSSSSSSSSSLTTRKPATAGDALRQQRGDSRSLSADEADEERAERGGSARRGSKGTVGGGVSGDVGTASGSSGHGMGGKGMLSTAYKANHSHSHSYKSGRSFEPLASIDLDGLGQEEGGEEDEEVHEEVLALAALQSRSGGTLRSGGSVYKGVPLETETTGVDSVSASDGSGTTGDSGSVFAASSYWGPQSLFTRFGFWKKTETEMANSSGGSSFEIADRSEPPTTTRSFSGGRSSGVTSGGRIVNGSTQPQNPLHPASTAPSISVAARGSLSTVNAVDRGRPPPVPPVPPAPPAPTSTAASAKAAQRTDIFSLGDDDEEEIYGGRYG